MNGGGNLAAGALFGMLIVLAACDIRPPDRGPSEAPTATNATTTTPAPVTSGSPDPSVPPAGGTVPPAAPGATSSDDATRQQPREPMTPTQESSAMPMPGQANNHSSTALDPASRSASSP
jgi:hypothetical protein